MPRFAFAPWLLCGAVAACTATPGDDADAPCAAPVGTLAIQIAGLPEPLRGDVTVTTALGLEHVTASTERPLPGGDFSVTAEIVATDDPIVRTAYAPTIARSSRCTADAETVTVDVTYAPIATSGALWTNNANGDEPVLGFAATALATSGSPDATLAASTRAARGLTFDRLGNLWVIGGTTVDPTLNRYRADQVATTGREAEIELNVFGSPDCFPDGNAMAFDPDGNLWVSIPCADRVVRLTPAELAASGEVTPAVGVSAADVRDLAFDAHGNLWIAAGTLAMYGADRLGASITAPDQTIALAPTGDATEASAHHVAFDAEGNLWATVDANYNFARLDARQLDGRGARALVPDGHISVGVEALPDGIAFDESGDLWFAGAGNQIGMLTPAQQVTSSTYAAPTRATTILTSRDVGHAGDIAFYPAGPSLPLYHRLP